MTLAVNEPVDVGLVENVTVSDVFVAAVTVPAAPRLNVTVLWAAVVSKPKPLMVTVVDAMGELVVLVVT